LHAALTAPDAFGFYRPLTQVSLLWQHGAFGDRPAVLRATNLCLHLAVICAACMVAKMLLRQWSAALLATLAFILTPKAAGAAVMWISARGELTMALFVLLSVAGWMGWERQRRVWLLAGAWLCYVLAFLSKETAALLPLVLLACPRGPATTRRQRLGALVLFLCTGAALFYLRSRVGALAPLSADPHYSLGTPLARWTHNGNNYLRRALPAPLALFVLVGAPAAVSAVMRGQPIPVIPRDLARQVLFAGSWFLLFILPVVPINARSELYLYLPGFGLCVLSGYLTHALLDGTRSWRLPIVAVVLLAVGFAGYQTWGNARVHDQLVLSSDLVSTIRQSADRLRTTEFVTLIPDNADTDLALRKSIGGYFQTVLQTSLGREDIRGEVRFGREAHDAGPNSVAIDCRRQGTTVALSVRSP
jgi:hypothetical protein